MNIGNRVEIPAFLLPDRRVGTVEEVKTTEGGTYYRVRRDDGVLVDLDGDEIGPEPMY